MRYEVELRQPGTGDCRAGASWRPVSLLMRPRTFATLADAQAHAERLNRQETRIVAVEHGGWRRTVDEAET